MGDWKSKLNADPTEWLLEADNPSVRYFTLKQMLDLTEDDPKVKKARDRVMQSDLVQEILQKQQEPEYVQNQSKFYTDKYRGLVWSLITLAELGAQRTPQIEEQCEYLLEHSRERTDGGFAMNTAVKTGGGRIKEVIPCLTGNMVWCLIRFGYWDDPRLKKAVEWLIRFMRTNDGTETEPQAEPYNRYEICWGKHTCLMGVVKALKAFGSVPAGQQTPEVTRTVEKCTEFMLMHHIFKRSHDLSRVSKPGWLKFGFPLMYQTDVLEILDILSGLGIRDERMAEALERVIAKQDVLGRWHTENTYANERLLVPFEENGMPSKWLTLRALRVLKSQYS